MRQTLLLNTHTFSVSQFLNHSANSAVFFNNKLYFATQDGLYESKGDTDHQDAPISAHTTLPSTQLKYQGQKSPRSLLLAGRFSGQMSATITDEKEKSINYLSEEMENEDGTKIALRTDQRSRFFKLKISNVDGADFSLESADVVFIPGPERRK